MTDTRTQARINRSNLKWAPDYRPTTQGPLTRAAQRAELALFNNISDLKVDRNKSAWTWRFHATAATAEGAARLGFYVWKAPGSQDAYYALSRVD